MKVEYIFNDGYGFLFKNSRILLSNQAYFLCKNMDGKTSIEGLKQKFYKRYSLKLPNAIFYRFIRRLKEANLLTVGGSGNGYLMSKFSAPFLREQLKRFEKSRTRKPTYNGLCYKSSAKKLNEDLKACFASVDNHYLAASCKRRNRFKGIIVPHSNIELSGPSAAWAYQALTFGLMPDTFIIFAPDHSSSLKHPFSVLAKDFRMSSGVVEGDRDFAKRLAKKCPFDIFANSAAHIEEYAVEIQLPFLQYIYRQNKKKPKVVSILCAEEPSLVVLKSLFNKERNLFLQALREIINESGKYIIFVATGDLLHTEKWGGDSKFHDKNGRIIGSLKKLDVQNLKYTLDHGEYPICRKNVFATLFKMIKPAKGTLLNYSWTSNSFLIDKDIADVQFEELIDIGYASMVFY